MLKQPFTILMIFGLGTIFGSFLNVVALRYIDQKSFIDGRSQCPSCYKTISFFELIPVFSFLFLKGKCSQCHQKIGWRYLLVELLTGLLFVFAFIEIGMSIQLLVYLPFFSTLIILSLIDLDIMEIPDWAHVVIFLIALFAIFLDNTFLFERMFGLFVVSVPLAIITHITKGFGFGDVKLMAVSGLLLGVNAVIVAFFISLFLGSLVAIFLLIKKVANKKTAIPFGPFLCIGLFIATFYGNQIMNWYLGLLMI